MNFLSHSKAVIENHTFQIFVTYNYFQEYDINRDIDHAMLANQR